MITGGRAPVRFHYAPTVPRSTHSIVATSLSSAPPTKSESAIESSENKKEAAEDIILKPPLVEPKAATPEPLPSPVKEINLTSCVFNNYFPGVPQEVEFEIADAMDNDSFLLATVRR